MFCSNLADLSLRDPQTIVWCRIERGEKTKRVAIIEEEVRFSGESLERDITEKIQKLAMRAQPPTFEDMKMSDAFRDEESDNEEERRRSVRH